MLHFEIKDVQSMKSALTEFCRFLTDSRVSAERVFDSKLIVDELVSNVLRHAEGVACFTGLVSDGFVVVRVLSNVAYVPPTQSVCSSVYSEHGRGLFLVDSICSERFIDEDGAIVVKIKMG